MKIDNNTILVFLISIFLVLTIANAGMMLNDEWMTGAQLHQLYEGHQIVYNEGKYGYFVNGTPSAYMSYRNNVLMYPLTLPLAALPAMFILSIFGDNFRVAILVAWIIIGGLAILMIRDKRPDSKYVKLLYPIWLAVSGVNIYLYSGFPFVGPFIPGEVAAIVITNIFLFGALAAITFVTAKEIFGYNLTAWFATGATMVCSSVIFWSTTTKDHTLTMLLVAIIILALIKFAKRRKMKFVLISAVTSGLLLWIRPEIGVGVMAAILLCAALFSYQYGKKQLFKYIAITCIILAISTAPFFANNLLVSGYPLRTPFMMSNRGYDNYTTFTYYAPPTALYSCSGNCSSEYYAYNKETGKYDAMAYHEVGPYIFGNVPRLFLNPASGAVSLLAIIPLIMAALFGIPEMLRRKFIAKEKFWLITHPERILLIMVIATMAFHIYKGTALAQQSDFGIFPDLRYFTPMYGAITLMSLSMITRTFEINIKKVIKNTMFFALMLTVILMGAVVLSPGYMAIQANFNQVVSEMALGAFGLTAILMIQDIRNGTRYMSSIIIPMLISIPFAWNFITTFIYTGTKMAGYPMLLPLSQFVYNFMFGLT